MVPEFFELLKTGDLEAFRRLLAADPGLANSGVPIWGSGSAKGGHPLHRLCDAVFAKIIRDEQAIEFAKILLQYGADIDGYKNQNDINTPLIAASSLHAEKLGIFYIDEGADILYADPIGGSTALHWAAYCGRDKLVKKLIGSGAEIERCDLTYNSTPIVWAIQPLVSNDKKNIHNQMNCIRWLLTAGADQSKLDAGTISFLSAAAEQDERLKQLMK